MTINIKEKKKKKKKKILKEYIITNLKQNIYIYIYISFAIILRY